MIQSQYISAVEQQSINAMCSRCGLKVHHIYCDDHQIFPTDLTHQPPNGKILVYAKIE